MTLPRILLILLIVLAGLALYVAADGRASETAASPPQTAIGPRTPSEWHQSPPDASVRVLTPLRPAPVEEAGAPTAGLGDPSPGSANQKVQVAMGSGLDPTTGSGGTSPLPSFPATPNQLPATPNSGICASPCAVDVAEWDIPTPEPPTFNGLHPIADSWRVGVASGKASHMGPGFPSWYLALPIGPGFKVRIVGAGGHVEMWSTDAGPSLQKQREGRVADLSVAVFTHVCGVPASLGLCPVSISVLGRRVSPP